MGKSFDVRFLEFTKGEYVPGDRPIAPVIIPLGDVELNDDPAFDQEFARSTIFLAMHEFYNSTDDPPVRLQTEPQMGIFADSKNTKEKLCLPLARRGCMPTTRKRKSTTLTGRASHVWEP